jgi:Dyp-type peroxidase family
MAQGSVRLGRPANLPKRKLQRANFDLSDIQGNVLRGYTYPCAAYLFLRIDDPQKARALMARMLPQISTAETWQDGMPETALHVALTYAGLQAVGVAQEILDSFPEEFREGQAARAERLGDRGPSAPEHWEPGLGTGEAHVLVTVYATDGEKLDAARMALKTVGAEGAVTVINETRAAALEGGHDHFGFADGIAQPALEGSNVSGRPGDGQPNGDGTWRNVAAGEFLLGHQHEDGTLPAAPKAPFDRNGTFMVYRKLQQHVAAFRAFIDTEGAKYPGGPEMLGAKIVGRWPDGTPLSLSPDKPDAEIAADPARINDFAYADDAEGLRCPIGAHIRRANPRDMAEFFDGRLTNRHRIVRRGRSYGTPLPPGAAESDGADRGLVFICFQSNIWRQFETIQALWMDDGDPFGLGADKDPLIGEQTADGKMTIQGNPPHFVKPHPRFVTMRGGEYLFRPSMTALRMLAEGAV